MSYVIARLSNQCRNSVMSPLSRVFDRCPPQFNSLRRFSIKPIIIKKNKQPTPETPKSTGLPQHEEPTSAPTADPTCYSQGRPQGRIPRNNAVDNEAVDDGAEDEIQRILERSGIDLASLESTPVEFEDDTLLGDEQMDDSDIEFNGFDKFTKPQFDFPPGSFLHMVSLMLEANPGGVLMFPMHMRKPLLDKVASNVRNAIKRYPNLGQQDLFNIVQHTFITDGPDMAYTHDQAINILFPMAPKKNDIVDMPGIEGKCIVTNREYIDNRDDKNLPVEERVQVMVLNYECLHPSLRGRTMRALHNFDPLVYKLTMAADEKGLEDLMHDRGLIDKFTGKILIDDHENRAMAEGITASSNVKLSGPGSGMARIAAMSNLPHKHGFQDSHQYISGGKVHQQPPPRQPRAIKGAVDANANANANASLTNNTSTYNGFGEALPGKPSERPKIPEYQRQHVITGDAAARLHKQLLYELNTGAPAGSAEEAMQAQARAAAAAAARTQRPQADDIVNTMRGNTGSNTNTSTTSTTSTASSTAKTTTESSINSNSTNNSHNSSNNGSNGSSSVKMAYDSMPDPSSGSTHTQAPIRGNNQSFGELKKQAARDEASAISGMNATTIESKYAQKREEAKPEIKMAVNAALSSPTTTVSPAELESKRKSTLEKLKAEEISREDPYANMTRAEKEHMILTEVEQKEAILNARDRERLQRISDESAQRYDLLSEEIKSKYRHCILSTGMGAGLPDPLMVNEGDDLLAIYPDANVGLMDAISDQWDNMMLLRQESGEELPENPEELRFRMMATVASAGKHAFSLDYLQELFRRFNAKPKPKAHAAAVTTNNSISSGDVNPTLVEQQKQKIAYSNSISEAELTDSNEERKMAKMPPRQRKVSVLEHVEKAFGQKVVPVEEAAEIPAEFRKEVKRYYALKEQANNKRR